MMCLRCRTTLSLVVCLALAGDCTLARGQDAGSVSASPPAVDQSQSAPPPSKLKMNTPRTVHPFPRTSVMPAGMDAPNTPSPEQDKDGETANKKRGEWVIAPIPFSNQAIHFGLVPVVEYVLRLNPNDRVSPPSSLIVAGTVATRGTWALGGGGELYFKQDHYRVTVFGGHGSVGYDLFGVGKISGDQGASIPLRQQGSMVLGEVLFRLVNHVYLGPRMNFRDLSASLDSSATANLPPGIDPADLGAEYRETAFGAKLLWDTRKDLFYPTTGHTLQLDADAFHAKRITSLLPDKDLNYQNYVPSYNHYLPLGKTELIAFRGMMCSVQGSPPFYDLCQFGTSSDIRGYQPGRYRDRRMFAAQAEYRQTVGKRLGFVVFAGVGEVAHNWNQFTASGLLPAGGPGVRFNLSKKERINLRGDIGYGKNGWSWNFALGEAF